MVTNPPIDKGLPFDIRVKAYFFVHKHNMTTLYLMIMLCIWIVIEKKCVGNVIIHQSLNTIKFPCVIELIFDIFATYFTIKKIIYLYRSLVWILILKSQHFLIQAWEYMYVIQQSWWRKVYAARSFCILYTYIHHQ